MIRSAQMVSNRIDALEEPQSDVARNRRVHQLPGVVGDVFAECALAAGHGRFRRHRRAPAPVRENDLLVRIPAHRYGRARHCDRETYLSDHLFITNRE